MSKKLKVIDCFGDMCPIPILKAEKELANIDLGDSFVLITDHSCVSKSIEDKYSKRNVQISMIEPMNGVWEITFTKG